jgi:malate dehydrogenase (oxaloacetate-decarboxylating)(NADP+)
VVKSRSGLAEHKLRYAHDAKPADDFLAAVRAIEPTAIIGVSTVAKAFNQEIVETMAKMNQRPIIFALSNPTSKSECSAEEAYRWTKGKAIYASGSPFPPVSYEGKTFVPGQGNNAYIFPGVGLGAVATGSRRITDRMFSTAARTLASMVEQSDLDMGRMYPSLTRIREISLAIGTAVAETVYQDGFAQIERPADLKAAVKAAMWEPEYDNYVA